MKKSSEDLISMFLGLVVVIAVVGLIFGYFQRRKGSVDIPGTSQTLTKPLEKVTLTGSKEYVVKKGDNLWKIAEANYGSGYKWVDISKANDFKNPGVLLVGQKLILPKAAEKIVPTSNQQKIDTGSYKVVKNDNLWSISVRAYGDGYRWTEIWRSNKNKLRDPDKLEIGMELMLPEL